MKQKVVNAHFLFTSFMNIISQYASLSYISNNLRFSGISFLYCYGICAWSLLAITGSYVGLIQELPQISIKTHSSRFDDYKEHHRYSSIKT